MHTIFIPPIFRIVNGASVHPNGICQTAAPHPSQNQNKKHKWSRHDDINGVTWLTLQPESTDEYIGILKNKMKNVGCLIQT